MLIANSIIELRGFAIHRVDLRNVLNPLFLRRLRLGLYVLEVYEVVEDCEDCQAGG